MPGIGQGMLLSNTIRFQNIHILTTHRTIDFMRDTLYSGRGFRTFNAVDDFNREVLAVEVDTNLPAGRVLRVLDRVAEERGRYPEKLRMDNGPEFASSAMAARAEQHGVGLEFIQPGKPTQNSYPSLIPPKKKTRACPPPLGKQTLTGWAA